MRYKIEKADISKWESEEDLLHFFKEVLPAEATELDASNLTACNPQQIQTIFTFIPARIRQLSLASSANSKFSLEDWISIIKAIPANIRSLHLVYLDHWREGRCTALFKAFPDHLTELWLSIDELSGEEIQIKEALDILSRKIKHLVLNCSLGQHEDNVMFLKEISLKINVSLVLQFFGHEVESLGVFFQDCLKDLYLTNLVLCNQSRVHLPVVDLQNALQHLPSHLQKLSLPEPQASAYTQEELILLAESLPYVTQMGILDGETARIITDHPTSHLFKQHGGKSARKEKEEMVTALRPFFPSPLLNLVGDYLSPSKALDEKEEDDYIPKL